MLNNIKITLTDGNEIKTGIKGTHEEIIEHYQQNNYFTLNSSVPESNQIKRIEFLDAPIQENCSSKVYLFIQDENGLYQ